MILSAMHHSIRIWPKYYVSVCIQRTRLHSHLSKLFCHRIYTPHQTPFAFDQTIMSACLYTAPESTRIWPNCYVSVSINRTRLHSHLTKLFCNRVYTPHQTPFAFDPTVMSACLYTAPDSIHSHLTKVVCQRVYKPHQTPFAFDQTSL